MDGVAKKKIILYVPRKFKEVDIFYVHVTVQRNRFLFNN